METIAAGARRAAPAGLPAPDGDAAETTATPAPCQHPAPTPQRQRGRRGQPARWRRPARWVLTALLSVTLIAVLYVLYGDAPLRSAMTAFHDVRWEFLPALGALSALHYVLAAIALRGAAGQRLPLYETTLTQFTAAAANRVTPSGLGAVAVNTRYLVCRGMPLGKAAVAVAALQLAGIPADLILLTLVLVIAQDARMLETLAAQATKAIDLLPPAPALIGTALLLPVAALLIRQAVRSPSIARALSGMTELCRRPGDLGLTLTASAATTFVLGLAFALSVLAVPGTATPNDIPPLLAAYLVGAAAGAALPAPGGLGSTEAALVATLAAIGIGTGTALQAVLLFRVITFWAPVPIGLLTWRSLRRRTELDGRAGTTAPPSRHAADTTRPLISPVPAPPEGVGTPH